MVDTTEELPPTGGAEEFPPHIKRLHECDLDEFKKFYELFPKGNPEKAWNLIRQHVIQETTFFGDPVTFKMITSKWKEYIDFCNEEVRENKYIKSFETFVLAKDYQSNFKVKEKKSKVSFIDKLKS